MPTVLAPDGEGIRAAAAALRAGALVVFPTETVYGLGAHALDLDAVARVFEAKGRPADNPLIMHVADAEAARGLASSWPEAAGRLAAAFWPGPLTLVLPRAPHVPGAVSARLETVAVRVPAHPVAQSLLRESGTPVVAPSANRSGRPSPTRVEDAVADLGDAVAVYLDGGRTDVGLESTVVGVPAEGPVVLLRPGGVPVEELERVVGAVRLVAGSEEARASPGTRHRHYAPHARVVLVDGTRDALQAEQGRLVADGLRVAVVAGAEDAWDAPGVQVPGRRDDAAAWAREVFALLRDLDRDGFDAVVVQTVPEAGLGRAVMDRLRRAASGSAGR